MTHGQLDIGSRGSHIYGRHCVESRFGYEISDGALVLLDADPIPTREGPIRVLTRDLYK